MLFFYIGKLVGYNVSGYKYRTNLDRLKISQNNSLMCLDKASSSIDLDGLQTLGASKRKKIVFICVLLVHICYVVRFAILISPSLGL